MRPPQLQVIHHGYRQHENDEVRREVKVAHGGEGGVLVAALAAGRRRVPVHGHGLADEDADEDGEEHPADAEARGDAGCDLEALDEEDALEHEGDADLDEAEADGEEGLDTVRGLFSPSRGVLLVEVLARGNINRIRGMTGASSEADL